MSEVLYGRTPKGQLLYDFGFTRLTERWLARKHKMRIAEVRKVRRIVRKALGYPRLLKK